MGKSVLIVEDETLIRVLCADVFRDAGYYVMEAGSGDEAMEMLEDGRGFTAIVSDVRMPGIMDGIALCRAVKQRWPNTKVVLTSGYVRPEQGDLPPDQVFVKKPYKFLDLVRKVDDLIAA